MGAARTNAGGSPIAVLNRVGERDQASRTQFPPRDAANGALLLPRLLPASRGLGIGNFSSMPAADFEAIYRIVIWGTQ